MIESADEKNEGISRASFLKAAVVGFGVTGLSMITAREAFALTRTVEPGAGTLSAAIALASSGDSIILKSGLYTETAQINISGKTLSIIGQGEGISIIQFSNCNGFNVSYSTQLNKFIIKDVSLQTNVANAYKAILITNSVDNFERNPSAIIENVDFRGVSSTAYWSYCIQLERLYESVISRCRFLGYINTFNGTFIYLRSTVNTSISDCHGWWGQIGVNVGYLSGASFSSEGIMISNSLFGCLNQAILIVGQSSAPVAHVSLIGCILDWCKSHCIYGDYVRAIKVGQTWLALNQGYSATGQAVGLSVNTSECSVIGCHIEAYNFSSGPNGIVIVGNYNQVANNDIIAVDTGIWISGGDYNTITGNSCRGCRVSGCYISSGSTKNVVVGNYCANGIFDGGANNIIANNITA
jgi:hypothetical protein